MSCLKSKQCRAESSLQDTWILAVPLTVMFHVSWHAAAFLIPTHPGVYVIRCQAVHSCFSQAFTGCDVSDPWELVLFPCRSRRGRESLGRLLSVTALDMPNCGDVLSRVVRLGQNYWLQMNRVLLHQKMGLMDRWRVEWVGERQSCVMVMSTDWRVRLYGVLCLFLWKLSATVVYLVC